MFLTKVAITPTVHNFFLCIFCLYLSNDTGFYNYLLPICLQKNQFKKKKKIIFLDFFDEFKDLWKMKGTYFFL